MKDRMTRLAFVVAISMGLLGGCLGRSPEIRTYVMGRPVVAEVAATAPSLSVHLGSVVLPDHLRRAEMVWRRGDAEVRIDSQNRWAGGLEANVLRVLGRGLGAHLGTLRVSVHPNEPRVPARVRVDIDFDELAAEEGGPLRASVRWLVRIVPDGVIAGGFAFEESLAGGTPAALVRAHEAILDDIAAQISAQIVEAVPAGEEA